MNSADLHPFGWKTVPLRYVCELSPSVAFDGLGEDDDLTFLPMDRVKSGYFIPNADKFSKYGSSYTAFEDGDIVLAKVTPCFENGNIAIADDLIGGKGFGSSELFVIRPTAAERRFLFYYFQSLIFKQDGEASMTGAGGLKRVSPDVLRQHHLPCPSQDVQRRIANYLDRETARIDGLIAEKEKMLALLEEKRAALISRVVTRGLDPTAPLKPSGQEWLGDIPAHWRLERLKFHLLGLEQGWSPQCDNYPAEPDDWGVLKVGAVNAWSFNPVENKRLPDEVEPLLEYEIKQHDVLMSRANTTQLLGSVVYVNELSSKLLLCDKLYRLSSNDDQLDREFLVAFLRASPGRFQLEREASGTSGSMQNIGQDTVQNAWIAIPPLDEQKKISGYISDYRRQTEKMYVALRRTVDLLTERRAALITAAVTGQIPLEEMSA
ncbi:hypothetical protein AGMMS49960_14290 [Betaproteobacteria bacterium]|nr:hypothetical protein AGMMS49960_14290 [Betaproteobacteria bacterium]GHU16497.1 hypothetical protein AGMMS50243_02730 [Betaproteobacteria bacterium]